METNVETNNCINESELELIKLSKRFFNLFLILFLRICFRMDGIQCVLDISGSFRMDFTLQVF